MWPFFRSWVMFSRNCLILDSLLILRNLRWHWTYLWFLAGNQKKSFFFFFFINRTKIELQKNQRIIYCYHLEAFRHPNRMSNMSSYNKHLPINIWQLNKLTYCFARTMEMLKIGGEKRDSYSSILFSANCFTF